MKGASLKSQTAFSTAPGPAAQSKEAPHQLIMVQTDPSLQQLQRPQTQVVVTPSAAKSQHGASTASKAGSKQQHNRSSNKATAAKEEKKSNQGDAKSQQFKGGMR